MLPDDKREAILERDDRKCQWCGDSTDRLHVHHIKPRDEGGSDHWHNLVTLCPGCHGRLEVSSDHRQRITLRKYGKLEAVIGPPEDLLPWKEGFELDDSDFVLLTDDEIEFLKDKSFSELSSTEQYNIRSRIHQLSTEMELVFRNRQTDFLKEVYSEISKTALEERVVAELEEQVEELREQLEESED